MWVWLVIMDINDKINALSPGERFIYWKDYTNCLEDFGWCEDNGINYSKPDEEKAKAIVYRNLFLLKKNYFSQQRKKTSIYFTRQKNEYDFSKVL